MRVEYHGGENKRDGRIRSDRYSILLIWMSLMIDYWIFAISSLCAVNFACYAMLCYTRVYARIKLHVTASHTR